MAAINKNIISHYIIYHYHTVGAYYNNVIIIAETTIIIIVRVGRIQQKKKNHLTFRHEGSWIRNQLKTIPRRGYSEKGQVTQLFFLNTVILYSDNIFSSTFFNEFHYRPNAHTFYLFLWTKKKKKYLIYCAYVWF